jgi:hypothetical protein
VQIQWPRENNTRFQFTIFVSHKQYSQVAFDGQFLCFQTRNFITDSVLLCICLHTIFLNSYCEDHFIEIKLGSATNDRCDCGRYNISNEEEVMCHTCALIKRVCCVCQVGDTFYFCLCSELSNSYCFVLCNRNPLMQKPNKKP